MNKSKWTYHKRLSVLFFLLHLFVSTNSANAADWGALSSQISDGNSEIILEEGGTYIAGSYSTNMAGFSYYFESYSGRINGNGASIVGLQAPLFLELSGTDVNPVVINNLTLIAHNENNVDGGGILAEESIDATIENVSVQGILTTTGSTVAAGGLIGSATDTNVTNVSAAVEIDTAVSYVGGLIGKANGTTTITNSNSTGDISGDDYVGGLIGFANDINSTIRIENSFSTSDLIGSDYVGGLVGGGELDIVNSFNEGTVHGDYLVGGLVGLLVGSIENSYSIGNVDSTDIYSGGLIGYGAGIVIDNSFASSSVTGKNYVGGLVGGTYSDPGYIDNQVTNSYFNGIVLGSESTIGGIAGLASTLTLENSYSAGSISGQSIIGGLFGQSELNSSISNSFSISNIVFSGSQIGGLFGARYATEIVNSSFRGSLNEVISNDESSLGQATDVLQGYEENYEPNNTWAKCSSINGGLPYLVALYDSNPCVTSRSNLREFGFVSRKQVSIGATSRIDSPMGFSNLLPISFNSLINVITESNLSADKKALSFELDTTFNYKVSISPKEMFQIKLNGSPGSLKKVLLKKNTESPLVFGEVIFDLKGVAVLPALSFNEVGTYEIIFVGENQQNSIEITVQ